MKKKIIYILMFIISISLVNAQISSHFGVPVFCTGTEYICDMTNDNSVDWTNIWESTEQASYTENSESMTWAPISAQSKHIASQNKTMDGSTVEGFSCEMKMSSPGGIDNIFIWIDNSSEFGIKGLFYYHAAGQGNFRIYRDGAFDTCFTTTGVFNVTMLTHINNGGDYDIRIYKDGIGLCNYTGTNTNLGSVNNKIRGHGWSGVSTDLHYISCWKGGFDDAPFLISLPPVLSDFNWTANNRISSQDQSAGWGTGVRINATSNLGTGTFTTDKNANCTVVLNSRQNYTQASLNNSAFKLATPGGKSHAFTFAEDMPEGNSFACFSCMSDDADRLEPNTSTCSAERNFSRTRFNTSLQHVDSRIDSVLVSSSIYIKIFDDTFNTSVAQDFVVRGSGNVFRVAGGANADVSLRLRINQIPLFDDVMVTSTGLKDKKVFTFPINTTTPMIGVNNITIEVKTSSGIINITELSFQIDANVNSQNNTHKRNVTQDNFDFSSTSFENILNYTLDKTFSSFELWDFQHKFTGTGNPICYVEDSINNIKTPAWQRSITSETGSSGMNFIRKNNTNSSNKYQLFCKSPTGSTITSNSTAYSLDLTGAKGFEIQTIQNQTSGLSLSSGANLILSSSHIQRDGDELMLMGTVIIQSTSGKQDGTDSPIITINGSGCTGDNTRKFERSLSGNSDIATVKFYSDCELSVGNSANITIFVTVVSGETLTILNASLSGYEITNLDVVSGNVPPIPIILIPLNNEVVSQPFTVGFVLQDLNGNNLNATLWLNNTLIVTEMNQTNTSVSVSGFTIGNYTLTLQAKELGTTDLFEVNFTINITIDIAPNVTLNSPTQGQVFTTTSNITLNCTATDNGALVNISLYLTDSINSSFARNTTQTKTGILNTSIFNLILISGDYSWNCESCDNFGLCAFNETNVTFSVNSSAIARLCFNMSKLTFRPNISNFNYTTGKLLEHNVSAVNVSQCNFVFNLSNEGARVVNFSIKVNATQANYTLFCNNINVTTVSKRLKTDLAIHDTFLYNCTLSYLNAMKAYPFKMNVTVE